MLTLTELIASVTSGKTLDQAQQLALCLHVKNLQVKLERLSNAVERQLEVKLGDS